MFDTDTVLPFLSMISLLLLGVHLLATIAKLLRLGARLRRRKESAETKVDKIAIMPTMVSSSPGNL